MYPSWYWVIIVISFIFSMLFSSIDMAYSVVDISKLKKASEKGQKTAKTAYKLASDYEFTISTILFGNNVANILASSLVTIIGVKVFGEDIGAIISTIIFTVVIIIFAEFLPKNIAKKFNYSICLIFAYPLVVFKYLFFIFVYPISKLFRLINKPLKSKSIEEDIIDEDVLTEMVDEIEEKGGLEEAEADIVRSTISISETQAFEILTPRVDIFAINKDDDIYEIMKQEEIFKHSRIPVYDETIDKIIGILPIKELAIRRFKNEPIDILSLCYKPIVIPRNHKVLDLLEEFKASKIHIAIVIDEYGGTEGIITMEDILEEIVGDIFDETDEIDESYIEQEEGVFIIDGLMNIDDFFELIGYEGEFETDYSTVGGFVMENLDRFAKKGDSFIFENKYKCDVIECDEYTVIKLKVSEIKTDED